MIKRPKRAWTLIIQINEGIEALFFLPQCFLKEIENIFSPFLSDRRFFCKPGKPGLTPVAVNVKRCRARYLCDLWGEYLCSYETTLIIIDMSIYLIDNLKELTTTEEVCQYLKWTVPRLSFGKILSCLVWSWFGWIIVRAKWYNSLTPLSPGWFYSCGV